MPAFQLVKVVGAAGKCRPMPEAPPALSQRTSFGVGTQSQPFKTLKPSGSSTVLAPAPSAEALMPDVPAAPAVPPVICETGSSSLVFCGVWEVSVGKAVTCVLICTRCWALVALAACEAHMRRNSREQVVPTFTKTNVTAWLARVMLVAGTVYSR